jgi:hypothetical protein
VHRSGDIDTATIRELVKTWPIRQLRGVSVPPPTDDVRDPEWSWKYERKYGVSKARDRESTLRLVLNVLSDNGKREMPPIVDVLHKIKGIAFEGALLGFITAHQREDAEEADTIRRSLTKWLARAVRLHERLNHASLPSGLRFQRAYQDMLEALTFSKVGSSGKDLEPARDWLLAPRPKAAVRRRKTRGNPDAALVKEAHRLLSNAKVPRKHHREVLWAIGLLDQNGNLPPRGNSPQK